MRRQDQGNQGRSTSNGDRGRAQFRGGRNQMHRQPGVSGRERGAQQNQQQQVNALHQSRTNSDLLVRLRARQEEERKEEQRRRRNQLQRERRALNSRSRTRGQSDVSNKAPRIENSPVVPSVTIELIQSRPRLPAQIQQQARGFADIPASCHLSDSARSSSLVELSGVIPRDPPGSITRPINVPSEQIRKREDKNRAKSTAAQEQIESMMSTIPVSQVQQQIPADSRPEQISELRESSSRLVSERHQDDDPTQAGVEGLLNKMGSIQGAMRTVAFDGFTQLGFKEMADAGPDEQKLFLTAAENGQGGVSTEAWSRALVNSRGACFRLLGQARHMYPTNHEVWDGVDRVYATGRQTKSNSPEALKVRWERSLNVIKDMTSELQWATFVRMLGASGMLQTRGVVGTRRRWFILQICKFIEFLETKAGDEQVSIALMEAQLPLYLRNRSYSQDETEKKLIIHFFAHLCRNVTWCDGCAGVLEINGVRHADLHDCEQGEVGNPLWFSQCPHCPSMHASERSSSAGQVYHQQVYHSVDVHQAWVESCGSMARAQIMQRILKKFTNQITPAIMKGIMDRELTRREVPFRAEYVDRRQQPQYPNAELLKLLGNPIERHEPMRLVQGEEPVVFESFGVGGGAAIVYPHRYAQHHQLRQDVARVWNNARLEQIFSPTSPQLIVDSHNQIGILCETQIAFSFIYLLELGYGPMAMLCYKALERACTRIENLDDDFPWGFTLEQMYLTPTFELVIFGADYLSRRFSASGLSLPLIEHHQYPLNDTSHHSIPEVRKRIKAQLKWLFILGLAGAQDATTWKLFFSTRSYKPKVKEVIAEFKKQGQFQHDEGSEAWLCGQLCSISGAHTLDDELNFLAQDRQRLERAWFDYGPLRNLKIRPMFYPTSGQSVIELARRRWGGAGLTDKVRAANQYQVACDNSLRAVMKRDALGAYWLVIVRTIERMTGLTLSRTPMAPSEVKTPGRTAFQMLVHLIMLPLIDSIVKMLYPGVSDRERPYVTRIMENLVAILSQTMVISPAWMRAQPKAALRVESRYHKDYIPMSKFYPSQFMDMLPTYGRLVALWPRLEPHEQLELYQFFAALYNRNRQPKAITEDSAGMERALIGRDVAVYGLQTDFDIQLTQALVGVKWGAYVESELVGGEFDEFNRSQQDPVPTFLSGAQLIDNPTHQALRLHDPAQDSTQVYWMQLLHEQLQNTSEERRQVTTALEADLSLNYVADQPEFALYSRSPTGMYDQHHYQYRDELMHPSFFAENQHFQDVYSAIPSWRKLEVQDVASIHLFPSYKLLGNKRPAGDRNPLELLQRFLKCDMRQLCPSEEEKEYVSDHALDAFAFIPRRFMIQQRTNPQGSGGWLLSPQITRLISFWVGPIGHLHKAGQWQSKVKDDQHGRMRLSGRRKAQRYLWDIAADAGVPRLRGGQGWQGGCPRDVAAHTQRQNALTKVKELADDTKAQLENPFFLWVPPILEDDLDGYIQEERYTCISLARLQTLILASYAALSGPVAPPTEAEESLATAILQAMLYCPEMPQVCLNYHLLTEEQLVELWLSQNAYGWQQPSLSKLQWPELYTQEGKSLMSRRDSGEVPFFLPHRAYIKEAGTHYDVRTLYGSDGEISESCTTWLISNDTPDGLLKGLLQSPLRHLIEKARINARRREEVWALQQVYIKLKDSDRESFTRFCFLEEVLEAQDSFELIAHHIIFWKQQKLQDQPAWIQTIVNPLQAAILLLLETRYVFAPDVMATFDTLNEYMKLRPQAFSIWTLPPTEGDYAAIQRERRILTQFHRYQMEYGVDFLSELLSTWHVTQIDELQLLSGPYDEWDKKMRELLELMSRDEQVNRWDVPEKSMYWISTILSTRGTHYSWQAFGQLYECLFDPVLLGHAPCLRPFIIHPLSRVTIFINYCAKEELVHWGKERKERVKAAGKCLTLENDVVLSQRAATTAEMFIGRGTWNRGEGITNKIFGGRHDYLKALLLRLAVSLNIPMGVRKAVYSFLHDFHDHWLQRQLHLDLYVNHPDRYPIVESEQLRTFGYRQLLEMVAGYESVGHDGIRGEYGHGGVVPDLEALKKSVLSPSEIAVGQIAAQDAHPDLPAQGQIDSATEAYARRLEVVAQMKALMSTLPAGQRQVVLEELKPEEAKAEEEQPGETTVTELDDAGQVLQSSLIEKK